MNRKTMLKLIIFLFFIGISASFIDSSNFLIPKSQNVAINHPKIYISGESALDAFPNKTGSGTQSNPYKISNLDIDAEGSGSAIEIRGIYYRYLILDGISATGSGSDDVASDSGIEIFNCQNIVIQNCEIYNNVMFGVIISQSTDCEIINSEFTNNEYSNIQLDDSSFIEVRDNIINTESYQVGIAASGYGNNIITGNSLHSPFPNSYGIDLYVTSVNEISKNMIIGYERGIHLDESSNNDILTNEISDCQNGVYLEGHSNNNLVKNNKFSNNMVDFYETDSTGNRVINTIKIIVWSSVGGVALVGVILSIIVLPKVYKKRAPVREERRRKLEEERKKEEELRKERERKKQEEFQKDVERRRLEQAQQYRCGSCNRILPNKDLKFCVFCGTPLKMGISAPIEQKVVESVLSTSREMCTKCGRVFPRENIAFCVYCGAKREQIIDSQSLIEDKYQEPIVQTPSEQMEQVDETQKPLKTCPHCGKPIEDPTMPFCVHCGNTL